MSESYLSDDVERALRVQAPGLCRGCRLLVAKHSIVDRRPMITCGRPVSGENADILARTLLDLADLRGACAFYVALARPPLAVVSPSS